jgi:hypothetical protein
MFYFVFNIEFKNIEWSGQIYVRKNETIKESIKRHFPDWKENDDFGVSKNYCVYIKNILVEDLLDYLKDNGFN